MNATINAKVRAYWTQIANTFAGYDSRLLFACTNEPSVDTASEMSTLLAYEQTFISAVCGTGGNNSARWLIIQGPSTDIDLTDQLMNTLPNDPTPGRPALPPPPPPPGTAPCRAPAYDPNATYCKGDIVSFNLRDWMWENKRGKGACGGNDAPGGAADPWKDLGGCVK